MQGIIMKGIGGFYYVKCGDIVYECRARGKFRKDELSPMVGDIVNIEVQNNKGFIKEILPRTNELIRPSVANVTQAFIVFAIKNPEFNFNLLNKFLLICEYNKLKVVICFNKLDLATKDEIERVTEIISQIGYEILYLNAKKKEGIEDLKLKLNKNVTVFCGPSGVGKSTLLNAVTGKDVMETGEISQKLGRGKHTTRHCELVEIEEGLVVDTPGFSSLDIDFLKKEELQKYFPEFDEYTDKCKFNGCMHYKEPNCAVKNAVDVGEINKNRYEFYIKILEEIISRREWK